MLKIKDNVDLKELEKFEFETNEYGYYFEDGAIYPIDYLQIYQFNREIMVSSLNNENINDKLFDLIQAGLVEKV